MKTIRDNWYDHPHLYDIAFGYDPTAEVDFVVDAFRRFSDNPVKRIFEPFCGTGRIAIELARRGYRVHGLDINTAAIEYARERCKLAGVEVELRTGDVCSWAAPQPFDAIVTLIDSFRHLTTEEAASAAVRAFHRGLKPGGVLVIGIDVNERADEAAVEQNWTEQRDGLTVETTVSDLQEPGSTPGTSVLRSLLRVTEAGGRQYDVITDEEFRVYTRQSFCDLMRKHGPFEARVICDRKYDLDRPVPPEQPAGDIVAVFRRM